KPATAPRVVRVATPIWISRRTRTILIGAAIVALLLLLYLAPTLVVLVIGGVALAVVMSFPVRWMSLFMPRALAIFLSLVLIIGLLVLLIAVVVPILLDQLSALIAATPGIAERVGDRLPSLLDSLASRGLLPESPERFVENLQEEALGAVQAFAGRLLGGLGNFISGAVSVAITLFGIVFVAVYLLADARRIQAAILRATPHHFRHDIRDLWDAFSLTLSRYLGGLGLSLAIQGLLSAVALYFIGVPYAILLGAWVSITALIPYLGAWLGAI